MSDLSNVAAKITELKNEAGLSTNKLAKLAGISQSYLRDLELNKSQPTIDTLERIAKALEVPLWAFFADDGPPVRAAHLADERIAELPPEAQRELDALIDYLRHKYQKQ